MLDAAEPLGRKLVRKGFWLYFFMLLNAPTGYLVRVMAARDLSVAEFGVLYGVVSLLTFLATFSDLGFSESLNYFLPKRVIAGDRRGAARLAFYAFCVQAAGSLAIGAATFALAPWIASDFFKDAAAAEALRAFGAFIVFYGLQHVPVAAFNAVQDVKASKGADLFRMVLLVAFTAFLLFGGAGSVGAYAWAWTVSMAVGAAFSWILALRRIARFFDRSGLSWDRADFLALFHYSFWSVLAANVGTLLSQLDTIFVILLLGNEANGHYSNYLSLMNIPFVAISPMMGFLFPVFSELHARGDRAKMSRLKALGYRHLSVAGLYFGALFVAAGPAMARILFGEKFVHSGDVTAWSGPFLAFNLLLQLNFQLIAGTGRARVRMAILAAGLGLNLATLPPLLSGIPGTGFAGFGVPGAALASGIGWILIFALSHRATRECPAKVPPVPVALNAAAAFGLAVVCRFWFPAVFGPIAELAVSAGLLTIAYVLLEGRSLKPLLSEIRSARVRPSAPAAPADPISA